MLTLIWLALLASVVVFDLFRRAPRRNLWLAELLARLRLGLEWRLQVLVLLLLSLPALAEDGQTAGGGLMIAGYVGLVALIGAAGAALTYWLSGKDTKVFSILSRLWVLAQGVVGHVEAKVRPTIQKALADGKLSPEERAQIQAEAMAAFKEAIGPMGIAEVKKVLGIGDGGVEVLLSGLLERALGLFKKAAPPSVTPGSANP